MGRDEVTHAAVLRELAGRIDAGDARHRAALFWLAGSGLLGSLRAPRTWVRWIEDARALGYRYVVNGDVPDEVSAAWERAQSPTDTVSSQLFASTVICLSTPLGLALGRCAAVGPWWEHALFPLMQQESLKLFGDVAFPDDDAELELIFAQPLVRQAVTFCRTALDCFESLEGQPDEALLEQLLPAAAILAPPLGRDPRFPGV